MHGIALEGCLINRVLLFGGGGLENWEGDWEGLETDFLSHLLFFWNFSDASLTHMFMQVLMLHNEFDHHL